MRKPRYLRPYGPTAYLLEWEQRIDPEIGRSVAAYAAAAAALPHVTECIPAYASLLVRFLPTRTKPSSLAERLLQLHVVEPASNDGTTHVLPVCYAPVFAPDTEEVCRSCRLSASDLLDLHTARSYTVFFTGYRPGFSFLGETDPRLRVARRGSPRTVVPAGSVGLADRQTGIYPTASPGGWHLIGNCPLPMLLPNGDPRLRAGDRARFVAISAERHAAILHGHAAWNTICS